VHAQPVDMARMSIFCAQNARTGTRSPRKILSSETSGP
jgi:hypothetical protein